MPLPIPFARVHESIRLALPLPIPFAGVHECIRLVQHSSGSCLCPFLLPECVSAWVTRQCTVPFDNVCMDGSMRTF